MTSLERSTNKHPNIISLQLYCILHKCNIKILLPTSNTDDSDPFLHKSDNIKINIQRENLHVFENFRINISISFIDKQRQHLIGIQRLTRDKIAIIVNSDPYALHDKRVIKFYNSGD